jgi:hypothetical protein
MQPNVMSPTARVAAGAGGALLLAAPFTPWASSEGTSAVGWDVASGVCALLWITGVTALAVALTGGRIGLFRPDASLGGAADLLGVASTAVVAWQLVDLPEGAGARWGVFAALAGAVIVMSACGDYRLLRGAPAFPRLG